MSNSPHIIIEVLRPNGTVLEREEHAFPTISAITARCNELRRSVRDELGFTPVFRILRVDRNTSPSAVTDVTGTYDAN